MKEQKRERKDVYTLIYLDVIDLYDFVQIFVSVKSRTKTQRSFEIN